MAIGGAVIGGAMTVTVTFVVTPAPDHPFVNGKGLPTVVATPVVGSIETSEGGVFTPPSDGPTLPEIHITPKSGWPTLNLSELWKCRDLIGQLIGDGLSQADIGRELGVTRQAIQKMLAC